MEDVKIDAQNLNKLTGAFPISQIYDILENRLHPELNIFVKQKTGAGFYLWQISGDGWEKLSNADSVEAEDVRKRLAEIKEEVRSALADIPKLKVDNLFTTPGDECIFYKYEEDGNLCVRLVAWDYKAKRITPGVPVRVGVNNGPEKQKVVFEFTLDGLPSSGQEFAFKTYSGKKKRFRADEDGRFDIGLLRVGKEYEVTVVDNVYSIIPEKEKEVYPVALTTIDEKPNDPGLCVGSVPDAPSNTGSEAVPGVISGRESDPLEAPVPVQDPPKVPDPEPVKLLFSAFDSYGNPLSLRKLKFVQGIRETILDLDSSGCGSLNRDIFTSGDKIESSLIDSGVVKATFNLVLEPDELEYRLEFAEIIRRDWKYWVIDVLVVLLIIFLVLAGWVVLMGLL